MCTSHIHTCLRTNFLHAHTSVTCAYAFYTCVHMLHTYIHVHACLTRACIFNTCMHTQHVHICFSTNAHHAFSTGGAAMRATSCGNPQLKPGCHSFLPS